MSDQQPPQEPPRENPFPESTLGPTDEPEAPPAHPQADPPAPDALQPPEAPPPPPEVAAPPPPPPSGAGAWTESTGPGPQSGGGWTQPSAPAPGSSLWSDAPAPEAPAPPPVPQQPGMTSGDPLGGAAYPRGYTSPPPPGAGGPGASAFGPRIPGTYVLSGWWRRVGAAVLDGLIIGIVALAIMAPLGLGFFSIDDTDTAGFFALVGAFIVATIVIAVVGLAYAPVMMGATNGKTLGRMATGIRVVRADGQRMTFGWAALREIAVKALLINGVAGSFTFGFAGLLDVLWPLWDDENRALHDFVVNTRTVID